MKIDFLKNKTALCGLGWRVEGGGWRVEGGGWQVKGEGFAPVCPLVLGERDLLYPPIPFSISHMPSSSFQYFADS